MALDPKKLFSVSVKALIPDDNGKFLMVKENNGIWDLPGGRLENGEAILDALKRECLEEIGVNVEITNQAPVAAVSAQHRAGDWFLMLGYEVKPQSLDFKKTREAEEFAYCSISDLEGKDVANQTRVLLSHWRK
jgi:8-oxo-dGTP diphosphatase